MEKYENVISETTPLNVPTKIVVSKGILIKVKHLDMKQNQFEFKPFDKVLVRNSAQNWKISLFSHTDYNETIMQFRCINGFYKECIPYNEETAHLIGTNKPYKPSEPKIWQIASTGYNDTMTSEELSNFIQRAVINNKDITDFRIRYIGQ